MKNILGLLYFNKAAIALTGFASYSIYKYFNPPIIVELTIENIKNIMDYIIFELTNDFRNLSNKYKSQLENIKEEFKVDFLKECTIHLNELIRKKENEILEQFNISLSDWSRTLKEFYRHPDLIRKMNSINEIISQIALGKDFSFKYELPNELSEDKIIKIYQYISLFELKIISYSKKKYLKKNNMSTDIS